MQATCTTYDFTVPARKWSNSVLTGRLLTLMQPARVTRSSNLIPVQDKLADMGAALHHRVRFSRLTRGKNLLNDRLETDGLNLRPHARLQFRRDFALESNRERTQGRTCNHETPA